MLTALRFSSNFHDSDCALNQARLATFCNSSCWSFHTHRSRSACTAENGCVLEAPLMDITLERDCLSLLLHSGGANSHFFFQASRLQWGDGKRVRMTIGNSPRVEVMHRQLASLQQGHLLDHYCFICSDSLVPRLSGAWGPGNETLLSSSLKVQCTMST